MASRALVFCEDAVHVDAARTRGTADLLALTPAAAWACQQRGVSYLKPEDFYSPEELVAQYPSIFAIELHWLDWLDNYLQQIIPEFTWTGFRAGSAYQGCLMTLLDEFYVGQHVLRRVLAQTKPGEILYCPEDASAPPDHLQHVRSILPALLPQLAAESGGALREFAGPAASNTGVQAPRSALGMLPASIKHEGRLLRSAGPRLYLRSRLAPPSSSVRVLLAGDGYDLDPLALALRRKGCHVDWFDNHMPAAARTDSPIFATLAATWQQACAQPGFWSPFTQWGLTPPVRAQSALQHWWQHVIPRLWEGHQAAATCLRRKRYDAVVTWEAGAGTLSASILQAAQTRNVPRIIYQHGSSGRLRVCDALWYSWLSNSDIFLCYGSVTQTHIDQTRPANHVLARPESVGSSRLEAIRQRMVPERIRAIRVKLQSDGRRPIVLYIPTVFGGYGRDVSGELSGYPNVSYFELQQQVLRQFAEFPGVRLLYKDLVAAAGWYNPIPDFIRERVPNGTTILTPPLTELVWAVDAIIVDHVITALGEAALTRKPLVVYDGGQPGPECEPYAARKALERRARVAATPAEFVAFTRALLEANDFAELATPDDAFLRACVTHRNDGGAADRAAELIIRVHERPLNSPK